MEARPSRLLTLSAGLRHDQENSYGGSTNPRLGVIYAATERTNIKLLYGRAFRRPNDYELFYQDLGQKQSSSLVPERISTYEALVEQRVGSHFRAVGSAFRYDITDIVEYSLDAADSLLSFRNRGHARTNGLEVELEGRSRHGAMGRASYAYQLARDHETGAELPVYPRHLAKANLSWPLRAPSLLLSMEAQYVGAQRSLSGRRTGDYLVTNFVLLVRGWKFAEATAGVYNALDRRYGNPGGEEHVQDQLEQDGRTARIELRLRL
jgi:iron complex outermembrane receptor protein